MTIFQSFLEQMPDAVFVIDREYKIVYANKAAKLCLSREDIAGKHCYKILHGYNEPCTVSLTECPVRAVFERGRKIMGGVRS